MNFYSKNSLKFVWGDPNYFIIRIDIQDSSEISMFLRGNNLHSNLIRFYCQDTSNSSNYSNSLISEKLVSTNDPSRESTSTPKSSSQKPLNGPNFIPSIDIKSLPTRSSDGKFNSVFDLTSEILDRIIDNYDSLPPGVKTLSNSIKESVIDFFPDKSDSFIRSLVGGFFFLRFINPSIMIPEKIFDFKDPLDPYTRRELTNIAKNIQYLANHSTSKLPTFDTPMHSPTMLPDSEAPPIYSTMDYNDATIKPKSSIKTSTPVGSSKLSVSYSQKNSLKRSSPIRTSIQDKIQRSSTLLQPNNQPNSVEQNALPKTNTSKSKLSSNTLSFDIGAIDSINKIDHPSQIKSNHINNNFSQKNNLLKIEQILEFLSHNDRNSRKNNNICNCCNNLISSEELVSNLSIATLKSKTASNTSNDLKNSKNCNIYSRSRKFNSTISNLNTINEPISSPKFTDLNSNHQNSTEINNDYRTKQEIANTLNKLVSKSVALPVKNVNEDLFIEISLRTIYLIHELILETMPYWESQSEHVLSMEICLSKLGLPPLQIEIEDDPVFKIRLQNIDPNLLNFGF
ncbi:GTPase-activating protein [Smittium culicis]|uniref:GTPase-activating protein n=1 Tax=Smittium culicis TaxID=133412 RepID=A0A1R1XL99_9FUNG|nr:GTPase-activating protein [Smittium culicis]